MMIHSIFLKQKTNKFCEIANKFSVLLENKLWLQSGFLHVIKLQLDLFIETIMSYVYPE